MFASQEELRGSQYVWQDDDTGQGSSRHVLQNIQRKNYDGYLLFL